MELKVKGSILYLLHKVIFVCVKVSFLWLEV